MIENLKIENFKGIGKCDGDDFSKVNLFIGKNNCGKSTILEAIYYTLREFGGRSELAQILARRSNVYSGAQELWFNYDTKKIVVTRFRLGNVELGLNLLFDHASSQIHSQNVIFDKAKPEEYVIDGTYYSRDFETTRSVRFTFDYLQDRGTLVDQNLKNFVEGITLLESNSKNDIDSIERVLGILKIDNRAGEFGEYLCDVFGIGKDWEFVPHPNRLREFRAAFYNKGTPLFLNGFGDGIRYAIQLITKTMLTKDSLLLIEELESNQHVESLKKLIPLLVRLSQENNVQIFATTQNPQVWRLFEHEFDDDERRDKFFRAFHVTRDVASGTVKLLPQTKENADEFWTNLDKDLSGGP